MEVVNLEYKKEVKKAPKLRFQEFTGKWERNRVGEICDFIVPGRNKPTDFSGDIPWITTPDIEHNGMICFSINGLAISREEAKKVGSKIVPINSIIISCVGELGLVAISGKEIVINQQLHAFIPKKSTNCRFLLYGLSVQKRYMDKVATKTAVPYMNKDNCNSIPVNIPTLPEQQKIASFLSAVDKKIQQLTRKKELLEQYKKGVMQKLFSQEIRFKDENGKDYQDWEEKRLGDVGEINGGGTPDTSNPKYWNGKIQWYTPTEIVGKYISKSQRTISNYGLENSSAKLLPVGTILFTSRATIAELSFALEKCTTNQGFQSVIVANKNCSEFVYYWLSENKKTFIRKAQGSTFLEINKNEMKKIKIQLPCFEEQKRIGDFLKVIDARIESIQSQITQTQKFKKGLLQQMFV